MNCLRSVRVLFTGGLVLALGGCGKDDGPAGPAGFADPASLVVGYEAAFASRSVDACLALLQAPGAGGTGFRFYPRSEDLADIDWLAGQSWGHEREVGILSNCFDQTFVCEEATAAGFTGVGGLSLEVVSADALAGGAWIVTTQGTFELEQGAGNRVRSDVRLRLLLTTSTDGSLLIREMRELSRAATRGSTTNPAPSWGVVQSWYRERPPRVSNPDALIAAHAAALCARDLDAYASLLDDAFEFFPQAQDLIDFPWMTGESWDSAEELGMIRHMFDPDYASPQYGVHADSIDAKFTVTGVQHQPSDGGYLVDASAIMTVLYDDRNGARSDVRFEFRLVPHDGYLLIREIKERPAYATPPPGGRAVESESWASMKSVFR